jgi:uncharacterized protein (TIGR02001 family)
MNARKPLYLIGLLGAALTAASPAFAEEVAAATPTAAPAPAPAEPASPHSFSANIGIYGQYVFRGITYTNERPALQGGFDYAHSSGVYLGVWGSNVDKDALYGNTLEIDIYGGYAHQITQDIGVNVGFLQFYYPDNNHPNFGAGTDESPNTTELNAAATWKWFTLKYSYAVSDFFGLNSKSLGDGKGSSRGSDYTELNFNYTLPYDINLALHAGRQTVEGRSVADYTDYLVGVNKNFSIAGSTGWNAGVNFTSTNARRSWYVDGKGSYTGDDHVILFLKRTF